MYSLSILSVLFSLAASSFASIDSNHNAIHLIARNAVGHSNARVVHARAAASASAGSTPAPSSTVLNQIISLITPSCQTGCNYFIMGLSGCANGTSAATIASCACSSVVLGDIRSCAACISADATTTPANSTTVVADYNSFVGLCASDGLASVTGTVAVGQTTSSLERAPATAAGATPTGVAGNSTYVVKGQGTTALVGGLATSSPTAKAGGAGRNVASIGVAGVIAFGVLSVL